MESTVDRHIHRISVVMITRDRREQMLAALQHVHDLPDRPPVILVDNGSTDGSSDAVRDRFGDVQVITLERNQGAAARTIGVRAARTPYVAFSDDDSWWAPGALRRATDHFDASPRLALIAARILVGRQERLDPICDEMAESPLPLLDDLPGRSVLGFIACGAVVRRSAYLQVGGFSPVVFFFGEETVMAQDLAAAGWGLAYVDDVVAHHHPQPGPGRAGRARLQARNLVLSSLLRRSPGTALSDTLQLLRRVADPDMRGAVVDVVRRAPAAWSDRQRLPAEIETQVRLLESAHET